MYSSVSEWMNEWMNEYAYEWMVETFNFHEQLLMYNWSINELIFISQTL